MGLVTDLYTDEPAFGNAAVGLNDTLIAEHNSIITKLKEDIRELVGAWKTAWSDLGPGDLKLDEEKKRIRDAIAPAGHVGTRLVSLRANAAQGSALRTALGSSNTGGARDLRMLLRESVANNPRRAEYADLEVMKTEIDDHSRKTSQAAKMLRDMRSFWERYHKTANARTEVEGILQGVKVSNSTTLAGWSQGYLKTLTEWCQSEMEAIIAKIVKPDTQQDVDAAKGKGLNSEEDLENAIAELYRINEETANDNSVRLAASVAKIELESRKKALHAQGGPGGLALNAPPGGAGAPGAAQGAGWKKVMEVSDKVGGGLDKAAGMYMKMEETRLNAAKDIANTLGETVKAFAMRPVQKTAATEAAAFVREAKQELKRQEQKDAAVRSALAAAGVPQAPHAAAPQGYAVAPQGYASHAVAPQGYAPRGYAAGAPQGYAPGFVAGAVPGAAQWKPGPRVTSVRGAAVGVVNAGLPAAAGVPSGLVGGVANSRDVPGAGVLLESSAGMSARGGGGVLLGHQLNALQIVGDYITGKPGKRPLRSALAFHSMGSGKSALAHAILNLLLAVASGLDAHAPSSLACRVALLWQSMGDAERQMAYLRANQFSVLGGQVAPGAEIPGVITGSIDNSADHDALKNQLGLPTRSWFENLSKTRDERGKADAAVHKADTALGDAQREIARIEVEMSKLRSASGGMFQADNAPRYTMAQLEAGLAKAKLEKEKLARELAAGKKGLGELKAREQVAAKTHACTEKNPTLVIVDESHKILADGNLAYGILLACAVCGHARLVLMSGTPVTSAAPMRELTRLCMLLGGLPWVLRAVETVVAPAQSAALRGRVTAACSYAKLAAVLNRGADTAFEQRVAAADATLAQIGEVLRQVEEAVTAALVRSPHQKKAVTETIELAPLTISYYGRLNGNAVEHERYRDSFDKYDYSAVLRLLRDTHVAAVSYATQIDEEHEDRNFEKFPDGSRFTRTVDLAHYTVAPDGKVAWLGKPVLRGPPKAVSELWHSCREYVPAFVANRTVRILHVSVPPYRERKETALERDPQTNQMVEVEKPVLLYKGPKASDDVPIIYAIDWVQRCLSVAPGWDTKEVLEKSMGYEAHKQWGAYKFMWCLGVAFATACASRFEGSDTGPVAIYVDRKAYDLTAAQMELLVHAVFGSYSGTHKLHSELCKRRGVPYQGVATPLPEVLGEERGEKVLTYQIGWKSLVDLNARPLSAWYAPAAFGEERASTALDELVKLFGDLFPLPLSQIALEVQGKTTLFDDEVRLDMASKNMRGRDAMHVFVKDMYATEARGESLNVEGDNLEKFLTMVIIGMPEMSAQRFEQLLDRINRVNVDLKAKRKKRIIHITSPSQLEKNSTLARLGTTPLDQTVSWITSELARHAMDCDTNREGAESSAMKCAQSWADLKKNNFAKKNPFFIFLDRAAERPCLLPNFLLDDPLEVGCAPRARSERLRVLRVVVLVDLDLDRHVEREVDCRRARKVVL